ncbi:MAG TPA: DUF1326 domain-containing protein [Spongiibacteraceae bacterium]
MAYVDWRITGPEIAACNCDWGCPCQFNALPTRGDCRAMTAMRIDKGHFGNIKLDGLKWYGMFAWPGPIHFGNGEVLVVIDKNADAEQRDALLKILSGQETAPGATIFNVFAAMLSKVHEPMFADIEFEIDIDRRHARAAVKGISETSVEPIRNPITGDEHRVRVALPHGFEYHLAEFASGNVQSIGAVTHAWSGRHSHLAMLDLSTNGALN